VNALLQKIYPGLPGGRYDRILIFSEEEHWDRLMGVRLFGNTLVTDSKDMNPSAHFGVFARLYSSLAAQAAQASNCIIS